MRQRVGEQEEEEEERRGPRKRKAVSKEPALKYVYDASMEEVGPPSLFPFCVFVLGHASEDKFTSKSGSTAVC